MKSSRQPKGTSEVGAPRSNLGRPPGKRMNQEGRLWIALPTWVREGLKQIAQRDERSVTKTATVMLVNAVTERFTKDEVIELQRRFVPPASTSASE